MRRCTWASTLTGASTPSLWPTWKPTPHEAVSPSRPSHRVAHPLVGHHRRRTLGAVMPERIQLRRTKGWRKPEGAVVVARPTKWGNPWPVHGSVTADIAVDRFRADLLATIEDPWGSPHDIDFRVMAESLADLSGKDLACWCPLDQPCHADVLLELANG